MNNITPSLFDTFTSALTGITSTTAAGQELLNKFNAYLSSQQIDVSQLTEDQKKALYNQLYLQFLKGQITSQYSSEASNALSLDEIAARQTIFAVYSLCIQMLQALQGAMKTQSSLLDIYTQWQSNYTEMTAQLPIYGPEVKNHILVDNTDFGKTTLGYADLSVQQVFQSLLTDTRFSTTINPPSIVIAAWAPPAPGDPFCPTTESAILFKLNQDTDGSFYAEMDINDPWIVDPPEARQLFRTGNITLNPHLTGAAQMNDLVTKLMSGLTAKWQDFVSGPSLGDVLTLRSPLVGSPPTTVSFTVRKADFATYWSSSNSYSTYDKYYLDGSTKRIHDPASDVNYWKYVFTTGIWGPEPLAWPETLGKYDDPNNPSKPDATTLASMRNQEYDYRSEVNAQLQLFLTTAKSKSDTISAHSQQTQTVVSQIQQSLQAQADLLKSIVDTLTTLVSALFT